MLCSFNPFLREKSLIFVNEGLDLGVTISSDLKSYKALKSASKTTSTLCSDSSQGISNARSCVTLLLYNSETIWNTRFRGHLMQIFQYFNESCNYLNSTDPRRWCRRYTDRSFRSNQVQQQAWSVRKRSTPLKNTTDRYFVETEAKVNSLVCLPVCCRSLKCRRTQRSRELSHSPRDFLLLALPCFLLLLLSLQYHSNHWLHHTSRHLNYLTNSPKLSSQLTFPPVKSR